MANTTRPTTDAGWIAFGNNFTATLNGTPADYGVTAPEASDAKDLFLAFQALYFESLNPITRTKVVVQNKNDARRVLATAVGKLDQRIRGFSGITDAKLVELGLAPRKQPTRQEAPTTAPSLEVKSVLNNVLSIVAHGSSSVRSLEAGVTGVTVFSYIGATPPATTDGWVWRGNLSRATGEIAFAGNVTGKVWLCAVYYNDRGQGPACSPVGVNLAGANLAPTGVEAMKIAA